MKPSSARSAATRGVSAFTLIELLTVMAIILVLAGLILNIAGNANYNSAKSRAKAEIRAMETALESYKADNGTYPSDSNTNTLDAHNVAVTTNKDPSSDIYKKSSQILYQALAGFVSTTTTSGNGSPTTTFTVGKKYMDFNPSQLHVDTDHAGSITLPTPTSPYMYIVDPFGFSYGYSTAYAAAYSTDPTKTPAVGYNPTFDLWSTAVYAKGGKSTPTSTPVGADEAARYSTLWEKNW